MNEPGARTHLAGANMTWKWQSMSRVKRSLILETEYLWARVDDSVDRERAEGLSTSLQVQTSRRWWIQGRYDTFGPSEDAARQHRFTGLLAYVPSEFSAFRVTYSVSDTGSETVQQVGAQVNFTMGAHPAHAY